MGVIRLTCFDRFDDSAKALIEKKVDVSTQPHESVPPN